MALPERPNVADLQTPTDDRSHNDNDLYVAVDKMKPHSDSTTRTYSYCLERWYKWSHSDDNTHWNHGELEDHIGGFVSSMGNRKISVATISQHICALCWLFGSDRVRTPTIREQLSRYAYQNGRPANKAKAIGIEELKALVNATRSQRNKALLSIGWAGALRASEIVAIRRSDLSEATDGFELQIRRSKTDQRGKGKIIPLPYYHLGHADICPARNLETYLLRQADLIEEPPAEDRIFPVCTKTITRIICRASYLAKLPASYSSHSLRRGLATTAARNGVDDRTIMRHGRWRSRDVVDGYVEEGTLWSKTALDFLR